MDLIELMRNEFARSKNTLRWVFYLGTAMYLLTLADVLITSTIFSIIAAAAVVLGQVGITVLRVVSGEHYGSGERIRRLAMLNDSLGITPSKLDMARIYGQASGKAPKEHPYVGPYYESTLPTGSKRLVETLVESSFFTAHLARKTSVLFLAISAIGIAIVILSLVITLQLNLSQQISALAAQVITSTILFWLSIDIANMAWKYFKLSQIAEKVSDHGSHLLEQPTDPSKSSALILLNEYNCEVIQAPPIPSFMYKRYQGRLNQAWRNKGIDNEKKKS
jgi:putative Mn2+ efflux pump MntP